MTFSTDQTTSVVAFDIKMVATCRQRLAASAPVPDQTQQDEGLKEEG